MSKKALIIESNKFVRDFLAECFRAWGYEPETATIIPTLYSTYNFIIADYTTIKELNLIEDISKIVLYKPVIITSTMNCPEEEILKQNALCLIKPFSIQEFEEVLKSVDEGFHKAAQQHS